MNRTKYRLATIILKLDRIPRYGRLYTYDSSAPRKLSKAKWTWQRYGRWGVSLLDQLGWMWQWVDEAERRQGAASNKND